MSANTASIRELRTDFRTIKRKIEEHGEIVITDNGEPAYLLKALPPPKRKKCPPLPDYYARLLKRQPTPLSPEETRKFWEEERGDR
jgi:antitoxin (DNA-binding transcriptional repressor) of toxin-antitoxin stability system